MAAADAVVEVGAEDFGTLDIVAVAEGADPLTRSGTIDLQGSRIDVSLALVPEAGVNSWVLVHAGYALEQLATVPDLKVVGPADLAIRGGTVSFELGDVHPHDVATILDQEGVAIRAGHHCAKPLMRYLNVPATARASFYVYTTEEDIDQMVVGLHRARELFGLT